jgi:hypothetical protein
MRAGLPRLPGFLRTLVLGLVMLAIAGKPVLAELCDTHALSHLVTAAKHVDSASEARSDRDHASGRHATLHAFDATAAFIELFPALAVPPALFTAVSLPPHVAATPPALRFDSPFRPPIA